MGRLDLPDPIRDEDIHPRLDDSAEVLNILDGGRKRIIVDLDGTILERTWPKLGDYMPGAVEALKRFNDAGFQVVVHSCRLSPLMPDHATKRDPAVVRSAVNEVRAKLDDAGLTFVDIYTGCGKPSGIAYIDDRAERYAGRPGSWDKVAKKVLMRAGKE